MSAVVADAVVTPDATVLADWLGDALGVRGAVLAVRRLAGGHSSGGTSRSPARAIRPPMSATVCSSTARSGWARTRRSSCPPRRIPGRAGAGRPASALDDCAYWTAFGATIIVVTATRALVQWRVAQADVEPSNPLVTLWETAVQQADR